MVYRIVAGGRTFTTCATEFLASDGIYYGTVNLPVRDSHDYYSGFPNTYIYPGTRTVYVPSSGGGGSAQYLRITSVQALPAVYHDITKTSGLSTDTVSILLLGVIALCSILTIFFRR